MLVQIERQRKVNYISDITPMKKGAKKFNEVLLSGKEYKCNLAVCKAEESEDTCYLATNLDSKLAVLSIKNDLL